MQAVGDVAGENGKVALPEIEDARGPVGEREANRNEAVHRAGGNGAHECLDKNAHRCPPRIPLEATRGGRARSEDAGWHWLTARPIRVSPKLSDHILLRH